MNKLWFNSSSWFIEHVFLSIFIITDNSKIRLLRPKISIFFGRLRRREVLYHRLQTVQFWTTLPNCLPEHLYKSVIAIYENIHYPTPALVNIQSLNSTNVSSFSFNYILFNLTRVIKGRNVTQFTNNFYYTFWSINQTISILIVPLNL